MNLRNLSDKLLIENTETLAKEERNLLTTVLHHLREIDQRRLYSAYGYQSLHEMAVQHFEYSDDAAYRRIAAMRILKIMPEVEEKIQSGEINITHLSMAQKHFRQEKKHRNAELPLEEKKEFIAELAGQSARDAEKIVIAHSSVPKQVKPDKISQLTENLEDFHFTAAVGSREKLETLQGWHAHKNLSIGEIFAMLLELGLKEWNPVQTEKPRKNATSLKHCATVSTPAQANSKARKDPVGKIELSVEKREAVKAEFAATDRAMSEPKVQRPKNSKKKTPESSIIRVAGKTTTSRNIKASVRRFVFRRANGRCEICDSLRVLQVDHIIPRALGGSSDEENLRLLCRPCHQRAAIEKFGIMKMATYIN